MNSETVKELLPALSAAISDMRDPKKNAANPHFKNRFADLGEVLECIKGPLSDQGLVMTQHADGDVLRTRVWHVKSGEWIESAVNLVMDKKTAQAQGSAITYARRYALKALFGMHDTDDDGQEASKPRKQQPKPAPKSVDAFESVEHAVAAGAQVIAGKLSINEWTAPCEGGRLPGRGSRDRPGQARRTQGSARGEPCRMSNYNRCTFLGRLVRSPELRNTQSGTALCNATIAVNRKRNGEDEPMFLDVVAFNKTPT